MPSFQIWHSFVVLQGTTISKWYTEILIKEHWQEADKSNLHLWQFWNDLQKEYQHHLLYYASYMNAKKRFVNFDCDGSFHPRRHLQRAILKPRGIKRWIINRSHRSELSTHSMRPHISCSGALCRQDTGTTFPRISALVSLNNGYLYYMVSILQRRISSCACFLEFILVFM